MPLIYSKFLENNAELAIWHATEDTEVLESMLDNKFNFPPIKSERRVRELIGARILLKKLLGNGAFIHYEDTGKPVVTGSGNKISVAHTGDFVAVLLHPHCEAGIDIEVMNDRIRRIASKFVSDKEEKTIDTSEKVNLYKIWGAKEVAYKIYGRKGVDFKKDLRCFSCEEGAISIRHFGADINKEYILDYEILPEHNLMVVYGFDGLKNNHNLDLSI